VSRFSKGSGAPGTQSRKSKERKCEKKNLFAGAASSRRSCQPTVRPPPMCDVPDAPPDGTRARAVVFPVPGPSGGPVKPRQRAAIRVPFLYFVCRSPKLICARWAFTPTLISPNADLPIRQNTLFRGARGHRAPKGTCRPTAAPVQTVPAAAFRACRQASDLPAPARKKFFFFLGPRPVWPSSSTAAHSLPRGLVLGHGFRPAAILCPPPLIHRPSRCQARGIRGTPGRFPRPRAPGGRILFPDAILEPDSQTTDGLTPLSRRDANNAHHAGVAQASAPTAQPAARHTRAVFLLDRAQAARTAFFYIRRARSVFNRVELIQQRDCAYVRVHRRLSNPRPEIGLTNAVRLH